MSHSSETTWAEMSEKVSRVSVRTLESIQDGEEAYQIMLSKYSWSGNSDTTFANLLYYGDKDAVTATPGEIQATTDLREAMQAVHDLYKALTNVSVTTEDRAAILRTMA